MDEEIISVSWDEHIRKRPEMYTDSIRFLVEKLNKNILRQGCVSTSTCEASSGMVEFKSDGYKYATFKAVKDGKPTCQLFSDLTTIYTGGSFGEGLFGDSRCLITWGCTLNALSTELEVHAWDGESVHQVNFHNSHSEHGCQESGSRYCGLKLFCVIRPEFRYLFR
jgi:DNA gyrase/topoisomerase IV subunit B